MKNCLAKLDEAFEVYSRLSSQEAYNSFLLSFFMYAKEDGTVHVPAEINSDGQLVYGLVTTTAGYYYVVCTNADQLVNCPEKTSVVIKLDGIIVAAANDPEINGICVNPYSESPWFIPREYIKRILSGE